MEPLNDDSPMPFGPFKGTAMERVPAKSLLNLLGKMRTWTVVPNSAAARVQEYINDNLDVIDKQVSEQSKY